MRISKKISISMEIELQLKYFKEMIQKNSKNCLNYFIDFLDFYSKCRPHQQHFLKELIKCVYTSFTEQITEIQQEIKYTEILKFIIFPEEFPINESKEQNEMFLLLEKDAIDGFISFLSNNPTIDITKEQKLKRGGY